uniref:Uncharacterized protein n=1 Tax=Opuntia streptacantha TaxID=393608 RepID=A0A7C9DEB2_OPUST
MENLVNLLSFFIIFIIFCISHAYELTIVCLRGSSPDISGLSFQDSTNITNLNTTDFLIAALMIDVISGVDIFMDRERRGRFRSSRSIANAHFSYFLPPLILVVSSGDCPL